MTQKVYVTPYGRDLSQRDDTSRQDDFAEGMQISVHEAAQWKRRAERAEAALGEMSERLKEAQAASVTATHRADVAEKAAQAAPGVYRPGESLGGGLVAVPEEPTEEMLHAGALANRAWFVSPIDKEIAYKETQNSYRAMLAALTATKPQEQKT